jgi:hypothetical protein
MKKLFLLVPAAILTVGLMASEDATAGNPTPAQVALSPVALRLFTTQVKGTVDMSAARNGAYAGMTCAQLSVSATSQQMVTPTCPAGQLCFAYPKWVHSESKLTNGADANHCTYDILVPGGSAFTLSMGTQVNTCQGSGITGIILKTNPGSITVPFGSTKDVDLAITSFNKECIN